MHPVPPPQRKTVPFGAVTPRSIPPFSNLGYQFRETSRITPDYGSIPPIDATILRSRLEPGQARRATIKDALADMIQEKFEVPNDYRNNPGRYQFLPIGDLDRIFSPQSIKALVQEQYPQYTEPMQNDLARKMHDYRHILATLLKMKKFELLEKFMDRGISDEQLPLELPFTVRNDDHTDSSMLTESDRILFQCYQYWFLVPFFSMDSTPLTYHLPEKVIFPWMTYKPIQNGGQRTVSKVQIHRDHHNFCTTDDSNQTTQEPSFALKRVTDGTFDDELNAHLKVSGNTKKTAHIASLLLAIKQGKDKYLLFELADGDLIGFWKTFDFNNTQARPVSMTLEWAARQCLGLATALRLIHGETTIDKEKRRSLLNTSLPSPKDYGRHGDIKPRNILWFANRRGEKNHLVVTDLGSTRYHSLETRSNELYSGGGTNRYEAPEATTTKRVSRTCDIWSLGCVFLEFCIWWLKGYQSVRLFEGACADYAEDGTYADSGKIDAVYTDSYCFWSEPGKAAQLKPVVHETIINLQTNFTEDPFTTKLLQLVREKMIVVDPLSRDTIDMICTELRYIVDSVK